MIQNVGGGPNEEDPFALPRLRDEPLPDVGEDSRDLSMGVRAEVGCSFSST